MLQVVKFTFGPFSENTYLLYNQDNEAWIIDPGMSNDFEEKQLSDFVTNKNLVLKKIINTHAHIDHILGVDYLKKKYGIGFGIHEADLPILEKALLSAQHYNLPLEQQPHADFFIEEGLLNLGNQVLEVRLAPGHSPGSIVFYYQEGQWMIGGDVLFDGSVGRTDLPTGDFQKLEKSIKTQLYSLPSETLVYTGHGAETTIGKEKQSNPFVKMP